MFEEKDFCKELNSAINQRKILCPPLDVMLVGATGAGKSSTINAWYGYEIAKVGNTAEPETKGISCYPPLPASNGWIRLWDSQGLGDGLVDSKTRNDILCSLVSPRNIDGKIYKPSVDLLLVILDGKDNCRDFGTYIQLLTDIFSCIDSRRVFFAINKIDRAMNGRHWDGTNNVPDAVLWNSLKSMKKTVFERIPEQVPIVKNRNLPINYPFFYSAKKDFDVWSLLGYVLQYMPQQQFYQYRQPVKKSGKAVNVKWGDVLGFAFLDFLTLGSLSSHYNKGKYYFDDESAKALA